MFNNLWRSYWSVWKNSFVYSGCATRQTFWSFIVINVFIFLFISVGGYFLLVNVMADDKSAGGMVLVWSYYIYLPLLTFWPLILFFPSLSLGIRRMHDIGKSGWYFGGLVLAALLLLPILSTLFYYMLGHFLDETKTQQITQIFVKGFNIIIAIALVWLCCKPTKKKKSISSTDVVQ